MIKSLKRGAVVRRMSKVAYRPHANTTFCQQLSCRRATRQRRPSSFPSIAQHYPSDATRWHSILAVFVFIKLLLFCLKSVRPSYGYGVVVVSRPYKVVFFYQISSSPSTGRCLVCETQKSGIWFPCMLLFRILQCNRFCWLVIYLYLGMECRKLGLLIFIYCNGVFRLWKQKYYKKNVFFPRVEKLNDKLMEFV